MTEPPLVQLQTYLPILLKQDSIRGKGVIFFKFQDISQNNHISQRLLVTVLIFFYRKKCPYSKLFWPAFPHIRTEYGEILHIRTRATPNTDTFYAVCFSCDKSFYKKFFQKTICVASILVHPIPEHIFSHLNLECIFFQYSRSLDVTIFF